MWGRIKNFDLNNAEKENPKVNLCLEKENHVSAAHGRLVLSAQECKIMNLDGQWKYSRGEGNKGENEEAL